MKSIKYTQDAADKLRREVGRFVAKDTARSYLTDSLTGVLKENYDLDEVKAERLKKKNC